MAEEHQNAQSSEQRQGGDLPFSPAVGCLISLLIGVFLLWMVFQVGSLLSQGELRYAENELTSIRLWLVDDPEHQGLAFSYGKFVEGGLDEPRVCLRTRVRFLLWRNEDAQLGTSFCECFERQGGEWQFVEQCSS